MVISSSDSLFTGDQKGKRDLFYMDSGASSHMCWDKTAFIELEKESGFVYGAGGQKMPIVGKCEVNL